jgi:hypothetical protein
MKVLVGCPVNSRKQYCLDDFITQCRNLTYYNKELYFVDNSEDSTFHVKQFLMQGFNCDYISPKKHTNQEYITISQLKIRDKALKENFDYLLFLECDIFCPLNIIEQMIAYNKPIVAAQYFIGGVKDTRILKTDIEESVMGLMVNRDIKKYEGFMEHGRNTRSKMFGYGCTLIHRDILKKYPFRIKRNDPSHSDTLFYFDLYRDKQKVQVHPVTMEHHNSSWHKITDAWH